MNLPPKVSRGSVVRLVAPSGPFSRDHFEIAVERLEGRYEVRYREDIHERSGYLAGTDQRRAEELNEAISDPDAVAILCARGGYGATRLLPDINWSPLAQRPKWLAGFSDITALHLQWAKAGLASLHAPMLAWLGSRDSILTDAFVDALEQRARYDSEALASLLRGYAEGPLLGGNLSVISALAGTPFSHSFDGAILFLEDVGERPYRVDRMLTHLEQSGLLKGVLGVVLGDFTRCEPGPEGVSVEQVVTEFFKQRSLPVATGLQVGHGDQNHVLTLGASYELKVGRSGASLKRSD